jgi:hypothetical protein
MLSLSLLLFTNEEDDEERFGGAKKDHPRCPFSLRRRGARPPSSSAPSSYARSSTAR